MEIEFLFVGVAELCECVFLVFFVDGGSCEGVEARVGEGVVSFGGEFAVLASVGLVDEYDDVVAGVHVGYVLEFLDGGDDDFPALMLDEPPEGVDPVRPAGVGELCVGEGFAELFLELFAINEYEHCGVSELWLAFELPCGEEHGEGLP